QGRVFDEADSSDATANVTVVSESLVRKYFPRENPIGRRITRSPEGKAPFATVVGVVNDVRNLNLADEPEPEMYFDYRQLFFAPFATTLVLRTHCADPMRVAAAVQKEIRAITPDQPIGDVKTMRDVLSANVAQPRFYTLLLGIYAALALLLAATGILLGLAGSWALTRLIAAQLYRTQPTDPAAFAAVAALMIALALAATFVPARRALKVDPAIALRCE